MNENLKMPEPRRSGKLFIVGIIVGVVLIIFIMGVIVAFYEVDKLTSQAAAINITGVNYEVSGCSFSSFTGNGGIFNAGDQATFASTWHYSGFLGFGSCTINSVSTDTPGFSLVSSNAPLIINGGSTQTLSVTVSTPSSSYTGVLDVIVNAS
jgi:hypothetical protein